MKQVSIKFGHKSIPDEINLEFNVMKKRDRNVLLACIPSLFGGGGRKIEFTISDRKIRGDLNSICESNDQYISYWRISSFEEDFEMDRGI